MCRLLICSSLIGFLLPCVGNCGGGGVDIKASGGAKSSSSPAASKPAKPVADNRADAKQEAANKADFDKLRGSWKVREARMKGASFALLEGKTFTFKGNKMLYPQAKAGEQSEVEIRIDATKSPKQMNFEKDIGCGGAIYSIDGNRLVIVQGKIPRPTKIERDADKDAVYVVLDRLAEEKGAK